MTASARTLRFAVAARACAVLVMTVLTGLVAMHALEPAPAPTAHHERARPAAGGHAVHDAGVRPAGAHAAAAHTAAAHPAAAHTAAMTAEATGHQPPHAAETACHHRGYGDSGGGGHLDHADATCAASGVSGGPALAAPAPSGAAADSHAPRVRSTPATATERAPPSLSQLQLLRI
ncbi:MAG: DUF6153 family protein [Streptomyces sp.]